MGLKLKKEELESLSSKDVAYMIMEASKRKLNTADLFKKVITLMELPEDTFEKKVADFYTSLSTDKRFIQTKQPHRDRGSQVSLVHLWVYQ